LTSATATKATDKDGLPPGPQTPKALNAALFLLARNQAVGKWHDRYGDIFSVEIPTVGRTIMIRGADLHRQVFTAKPDVLHAGDNPLGDALGPGSLFSMDEDEHLAERRKLLPPFHGERMRSYESLIEAEANRVMDGWPRGKEFRSLKSFNRITLRIILRAVFGAEDRELSELEKILPTMTRLGQMRIASEFLMRDYGRWSPGGHGDRLMLRYREIVKRLIDEHLIDPDLGERIDILALMLNADLEGDRPIDYGAVGDELLTLLVAGHETTASSLAWTVERITRHPEVLGRLSEEAQGEENDYRLATINEVLRVRPVIGLTGRTVFRQDFELGGWTIPAGTRILCGIRETNLDPRAHPEADRFNPERYLGKKPDTYSWIPFGGGMRRCLGAAFAQFEMDIVLRTLLRRFELRTTDAPGERERFKGLAYAPAKGGRATVI
jgi:cytochrome P450